MEAASLARALARPRPWVFMAWVALDWACIGLAMAGAWALDHLVAYALAVLVIGNRQHALAILGHDVAHGGVSRSRRLNDRLGAPLTFWPLGIALAPYRRFHFQHHRHVGTPADPELGHKAGAPEEFALPTRPRRLLARVVADLLLGGALPHLVRLVRLTAPRSAAEAAGPIAFTLVAITTAAALDGWWVLGLWYAAMMTSFWACFRVRIWTEHIGTTGTHRIALPWWARITFAPHNTWLHYEHHRWPTIPQDRLPHSRALDEEVPVVGLGVLLRRYRVASPLPGGSLPGAAVEPLGGSVRPARQTSISLARSSMESAVSSS